MQTSKPTAGTCLPSTFIHTSPSLGSISQPRLAGTSLTQPLS